MIWDSGRKVTEKAKVLAFGQFWSQMWTFITGCPQYLHDPVDHDCLMVKTLKSFGGIPFCMTNVPQTMMSLQCSNPAYGVTGNAFDPKRESGGSSGGEGSLLGSGGSILGIGNDIGGSLRNPAIFNGIYSLKPTHGRHLTQESVSINSTEFGLGENHTLENQT